MKFTSAFVAMTTAFGLLFSAAPSIAQQAEDLPARVTDFAFTEAPDDHVLGSEDAALTLVVWASVTCPHCASWFINEWPIVQSELIDTGKLRFVFREFPTAPGNLAMAGFRLAECAPTADYMSIIEYQMENQSAIFKAAQEGRGAEAYGEIAALAGMETNEAMTSCLRNPDITAHIVDNSSRATLAGIKSVPAFLINGQHYKGDSDAKSLVALINDMEEKGISALPKDIKPADAHAGHDHN
ncbi:MAG: thioredoxin domain-containing protein [Litorimonas sp.]